MTSNCTVTYKNAKINWIVWTYWFHLFSFTSINQINRNKMDEEKIDLCTAR